MKIQKKNLIYPSVAIAALAIIALILVGFGIHRASPSDPSPAVAGQTHAVSVQEQYPHVIPPRSTLYEALRKLDVSPRMIYQIVSAAKSVSDLARVMPGTRFQLVYAPAANPVSSIEPAATAATEETLKEIKVRFSPVEIVDVAKDGGQWRATKIQRPVETQLVTFSGVVKTSLWESAQDAKMDPNLISELSEIFAWQVDFAREVRVNDRWRLSVERRSVDGEPIGWGPILAAEYDNAGESYKAVLFRNDGKDLGYFAPDGSSLRRMFLKSPVRYKYISSRFQRHRLHPILGYRRPHLGVDYAAPMGTPVRAVGDGVVLVAGRYGGAGNMIRLRHNSIYQTAYKHMRGFAKGIHVGVHVHQGQVIGYVGTTGLSTGPHLHFEFWDHGRYVDPLGRKFPTADPVPKNMMTQFHSEAAERLGSLPDWTKMEVSLREPATASVEQDDVPNSSL